MEGEGAEGATQPEASAAWKQGLVSLLRAELCSWRGPGGWGQGQGLGVSCKEAWVTCAPGNGAGDAVAGNLGGRDSSGPSRLHGSLLDALKASTPDLASSLPQVSAPVSLEALLPKQSSSLIKRAQIVETAANALKHV